VRHWPDAVRHAPHALGASLLKPCHLGVNRLLSDSQFRTKILRKVKDPIVEAFWTREFAPLDKKEQGSLGLAHSEQGGAVYDLTTDAQHPGPDHELGQPPQNHG
jgi:hypothetical protein